MASNLLIKEGANQDRYILSEGSGTDADPVIVHHIVRLRDTIGSGIESGASAPGATNRGLIVRNIPSGSQVVSLSEYAGAAIGASNAIHVRPGAAETFPISGTITAQGNIEVRQALASALNVSASKIGDWHVRIGDVNGSALGASSGSPLGTELALITRPIPSGTQTITGSISITGVVDVKQGTASALNFTLPSGTEVRQSNASALKATAEVYQANASAFQVTAEVRQATASALQITAAQATNASGWTVRVVTPSGDTAMDTGNSAVRVNLVAGGAGNGNLQDGAASQITATVRGYANASPLAVNLTDSSGINIPTLPVSIAGVVDVKQTTASALQATVTQATNASGFTVRVVTSSGDTAMDTSNSAVRVNLVAGGAGNGNLQDGAASQITATVRGYANASPLAISLTDASGINIPTLPISIAGVVDVKQTTASALNATVLGAVEVRQAGTSALKGIMEVFQATGSALTMHGEVQQLAASALKATAEVYQATASALNAQIVGELAHDAVDSGNPLKLGGKALSASPTNVAGNDRANAYYDLAGRLMVRDGNQGQDNWTATCAPLNSNIRATITRTAGAANVRQVCTGFTVTVIGGSAAPTASTVYAYLLDGPSGTTYLWNAVLGVQATAGATAGIARHGLWIKSSQASALTLEFNVAANNVVESVSMEGTTITEA